MEVCSVLQLDVHASNMCNLNNITNMTVYLLVTSNFTPLFEEYVPFWNYNRSGGYELRTGTPILECILCEISMINFSQSELEFQLGVCVATDCIHNF